MTKNVMLIDDNKIDIFINQRVIEKYDPNIKISAFNDVMAALSFLDGVENCRMGIQPPQIILLDINMPGMNGFAFFSEFKRKQKLAGQEILIFMLSSSCCPNDIQKAEKEPLCAGYIIKPLNIEKLKDAFSELQNMNCPKEFKKIV